MVQIIKGTLYTCECGYLTLSKDYASKHSKTKKCIHKVMSKEETGFVREEDYDKKGTEINGDNITFGTGDNNNVDKSTNYITNINLTVPERMFPSVIKALKDNDCVNEIQNNPSHKTLAILFKYTRGTSAEESVVKYDPIKNSVTHKDPVTGENVTKDLKKYRNEYILESSDIFDDDNIRYMPDSVKDDFREMKKPQYKTGKKKDDPIDAQQVFKICASGDHAMYKMPFETKDFYSKVAKDVDTQIKLNRDT